MAGHHNTSDVETSVHVALEVLKGNADTFFLLVFGMCVFFMQCGFAFLEAGAVRSKNTTNILIKNVCDSFVAGVAYWIFGYAFAFGDGGEANQFIGATHFASHELPPNKYAGFFFQYTFAATAATIVSGAVAERCEFIAYFCYSFFITGFIYPVVTHWVWGGGWLATGVTYTTHGQIGYQDFAGSGVVHVLGGVSAFVAAVILGPRLGRFDRKTRQTFQIRGHSVPIAALGGFILFFGFLAFNGGSQTSISKAGDGDAVAISIVNTIISGSFAAFGSLFINRIKIFGNTWSLLITINGALTGMVAACASCNVIYPWGACVIGIFAAISYTLWSWLMRALRIDDPLDAVAVHFGGGIWGVIALAFFHKDDGILLKWNEKSAYLLAWQLCGLAAIIGWSAFFAFVLFGLLNGIGVFRVPKEIEEKGLDIPKHNEPAYPVEAYGHGYVERVLQMLEHQHGIYPQNGVDNVGYERRLSDPGNYESPEVKAFHSNGYRQSRRPSPPNLGQSMYIGNGRFRQTTQDSRL